MPNTATISLGDKSQDFILNEKEFKTKSRGFHGQGKMELPNGKRYQINILCVEIGSKPK